MPDNELFAIASASAWRVSLFGTAKRIECISAAGLTEDQVADVFLAWAEYLATRDRAVMATPLAGLIKDFLAKLTNY